VQRRSPDGCPGFLADRRILVEQCDLDDRDAFLEIGRRHPITGIIHLAGSVPWPPGAGEPVDAARAAVGTLLTVIQAARDWRVPRISVYLDIGRLSRDTGYRPAYDTERGVADYVTWLRAGNAR
jgi:UDP-glucose 4-epimerase